MSGFCADVDAIHFGQQTLVFAGRGTLRMAGDVVALSDAVATW